MTITTIAIVNLYNKLRQLSSVELPAKVSYAITRNCRKLLPFVEDYETAKNDLIKKYGTISTETTLEGYLSYTVPEENRDKFIEELNNLENAFNEDIQLTTININDLDGVSLSVEQMDGLYDMINGED